VLPQLNFRFAFPRICPASICLLIFLGVLPSMAQSATPPKANEKFAPEIDISLGVFGQLTPTRSPLTNNTFSSGTSVTQITQGASASAGVLGTIHQAISPWLGYNVNFGYSRFAERYSSGFASIPTGVQVPPSYPVYSFAQGSIQTNMYELTAAYSIQGPRTKRWSTSAQLGGGGLFFLPTHDPSPYAVQTRATMVFGVGLAYRLSQHFAVRAEYRGLFYKNPDFKNSDTPIPISKLFTVTSEPTVSIVYTFGYRQSRRFRKMY